MAFRFSRALLMDGIFRPRNQDLISEAVEGRDQRIALEDRREVHGDAVACRANALRARSRVQPWPNILVEIHPQRRTVERVVPGNTIHVEQRSANVVVRVVGAAGKIDVVVLLVARARAHREPIGVHALLEVRKLGGGQYLVARLRRRGARTHALEVVELLRVHERRHVRDVLRAHVAGVRQPRLAGKAFARRHENDAVRSARAVDGRGGGVLQHLHRRDVVRVQLRQAAVVWNAVHHDERRGARRDGIPSANLDVETRLRARTCRRHGHAGHRALERLNEIGVRLLLEPVLTHAHHRAGDVAALLRAVADDDDFRERDGCSHEAHVDGASATERDFLPRIAEAGDDERGVRIGHANHEGTLRVRLRADRRALDRHLRGLDRL